MMKRDEATYENLAQVFSDIGEDVILQLKLFGILGPAEIDMILFKVEKSDVEYSGKSTGKSTSFKGALNKLQNKYSSYHYDESKFNELMAYTEKKLQDIAKENSLSLDKKFSKKQKVKYIMKKVYRDSCVFTNVYNLPSDRKGMSRAYKNILYVLENDIEVYKILYDKIPDCSLSFNQFLISNNKTHFIVDGLNLNLSEENDFSTYKKIVQIFKDIEKNIDLAPEINYDYIVGRKIKDFVYKTEVVNFDLEAEIRRLKAKIIEVGKKYI